MSKSTVLYWHENCWSSTGHEQTTAYGTTVILIRFKSRGDLEWVRVNLALSANSWATTEILISTIALWTEIGVNRIVSEVTAQRVEARPPTRCRVMTSRLDCSRM